MRWRITWIIALCSTVLALLLCEMAYRLVVYKSLLLWPELTTHHHTFFCEHDPLLGWRHKANSFGRFVISESSSLVRFNSSGLRGGPIPLQKSPDVFRVLVLGDSFVEGYTVEEQDTVAELLKRSLTATVAPRKVEVINAGVAGYSTDQEYLLMKELGVRYAPDLTIVMFCYNDIYSINRSTYERGARGGKPFFTLEGDQLTIHNVPVPHTSPQSGEESARRSSGRLSSLLYAELRSRFSKSGAGPSENQQPTPSLPAAARGDPWAITERLLREISALAGGRGHFVVSYIPRGSLIDPHVMATDLARRPDEASYPSRVRDICARNGIDFLDLTPELLEASKREKVYFTRDPHWNRNGNRVTAEALARFLIDKSLIQ